MLHFFTHAYTSITQFKKQWLTLHNKIGPNNNNCNRDKNLLYKKISVLNAPVQSSYTSLPA